MQRDKQIWHRNSMISRNKYELETYKNKTANIQLFTKILEVKKIDHNNVVSSLVKRM